MASLVFNSYAQEQRYWDAKAKGQNPRYIEEFRPIIDKARERDEMALERKNKSKQKESDKKMKKRLKDLEKRSKFTYRGGK